jgi:hypothetical protein
MQQAFREPVLIRPKKVYDKIQRSRRYENHKKEVDPVKNLKVVNVPYNDAYIPRRQKETYDRERKIKPVPVLCDGQDAENNVNYSRCSNKVKYHGFNLSHFCDKDNLKERLKKRPGPLSNQRIAPGEYTVYSSHVTSRGVSPAALSHHQFK